MLFRFFQQDQRRPHHPGDVVTAQGKLTGKVSTDLSGPIRALSWSPDGTHLAVTRYAWVHIVNVQTRQAVWRSEPFQDVTLRILSWSPDGTHVAACDGRLLRIWYVLSTHPSFRVLTPCTYHLPRFGRTAVWSPDGEQLLIGDDVMVSLFEVSRIGWVRARTGQALYQNTHSIRARSVLWQADRFLCASASDDRALHLWNAWSSTHATVYHDVGVRMVAWSPDGTNLATVCTDGTVRTITARATLHRRPVTALAWSPDSTTLATGDDQGVVIWNAITGKSSSTWMTHTPVLALSWSPDGRTLACGLSEKPLHLLTVPDAMRG